MNEKVMDFVTKQYEKQVGELEEKTRKMYEGKLSGAALDSVVEKAKRELWEKLRTEAEAECTI